MVAHLRVSKRSARFAWKLFKIKFKIKQKLLLVRQTAHLILESALRAEILQNQFKILHVLGISRDPTLPPLQGAGSCLTDHAYHLLIIES